MRRISEELIEILRNDIPGPNSLSNTALLYMNRQTFEQVKLQFVPPGKWNDHQSDITQMLGIPVMLYHGIPDGRWELVRRSSGENVNSGNVFEKESGALCGYRWVTYHRGGLVPYTRDHQCTVPAGHYPRLHCVCECGQASVVPPQ